MCGIFTFSNASGYSQMLAEWLPSLINKSSPIAIQNQPRENHGKIGDRLCIARWSLGCSEGLISGYLLASNQKSPP